MVPLASENGSFLSLEPVYTHPIPRLSNYLSFFLSPLVKERSLSAGFGHGRKIGQLELNLPLQQDEKRESSVHTTRDVSQTKTLQLLGYVSLVTTVQI